MAIAWTMEQVLALSPDASSTLKGKKLAQVSQWQTLGVTEQATWGECRGSGKKPYQTQIDLSEPAFRCSCPSRKFPCKHGLGLLLLLVSDPQAFHRTAPPDWVQAWLTKRGQAAEKKQVKAVGKPVDAEAKAQRVAKRMAKVKAGAMELEVWLRDVIRQGLAATPGQPYQFWEQPAARLVDAQAPGLARRVRELAGVPHTGQGWPGRLLAQLGQLYLLVQGVQRWESLPEDVQAELRSQLGWSPKQEEVLTSNPQPVHDTWMVLGKRVTEEENLMTQRVWLQGYSGRSALLLSFAYGSNPLDVSWVPGTQVAAELVFYPGLAPLRAIVKTQADAQPLETPPVGMTIEAGMEAYGRGIATNPWQSPFPLLLQDMTPYPQDVGCCLGDAAGHHLLVSPQFDQMWELLALSGGHPVTLFGEWDGQFFLPLSLWTTDRLATF